MTQMSFQDYENAQAEIRRLKQENDLLKAALKEILKLETSEDRWGGHISETGKIAQHTLVVGGGAT